jgi:hypothetical protein
MSMDQINNHPLYKVHTIDSAMDSLWNFYKQKFLSLFLASFAMGLVLQYISALVDINEIQSITTIDEMMLKVREYLLPMLIISVVSLLFTTILHYYIIFNPLDAEVNIFRSAMQSLRYFVLYMIIMVFLALAASFALFLGLLLVVIGILFAVIYVLMIYLFILPVMMVEGPSIANTISRTITLAHRNFWSNIGWTAVFAVIVLVVSTVFSGLILLPFTGKFFQAFTNPEEASSLVEITTKPLYIILSALLNAITLPLLPIFACILYFNGRAREEKKSEWKIRKDDEAEETVKVEDLYSKPLSDGDTDKHEKS